MRELKTSKRIKTDVCGILWNVTSKKWAQTKKKKGTRNAEILRFGVNKIIETTEITEYK